MFQWFTKLFKKAEIKKEPQKICRHLHKFNVKEMGNYIDSEGIHVVSGDSISINYNDVISRKNEQYVEVFNNCAIITKVEMYEIYSDELGWCVGTIFTEKEQGIKL